MALELDTTAGSYLAHGNEPLNAFPMTLACRFKPNDLTSSNWLIAIADQAASSRYVGLLARGTVTNDPVSAVSRNGGGFNDAQSFGPTTTGYVANQWQTAVGVFNSAASVYAYLDAVASTEQTSGGDPSGLMTRIHIGQAADSSLDTAMEGHICEAAVWNVALTQAEVTSYHRGTNPLRIRRSALVAYWPILGRGAALEPDLVGTFHMTPTNGPTWSAHAPCQPIFFSPPQAGGAAAAAPETVTSDMWGFEHVNPTAPMTVAVPY